MRGWQPKELLPEGCRLPDVSWRYTELEAMAKFHCSPIEWRQLSRTERVELITHHVVSGLRQAWTQEHLEAKGGKAARRGPTMEAPWESIRKRWLG